jgi:hypothetical protein
VSARERAVELDHTLRGPRGKIGLEGDATV